MIVLDAFVRAFPFLYTLFGERVDTAPQLAVCTLLDNTTSPGWPVLNGGFSCADGVDYGAGLDGLIFIAGPRSSLPSDQQQQQQQQQGQVGCPLAVEYIDLVANATLSAAAAASRNDVAPGVVLQLLEGASQRRSIPPYIQGFLRGSQDEAVHAYTLDYLDGATGNTVYVHAYGDALANYRLCGVAVVDGRSGTALDCRC